MRFEKLNEADVPSVAVIFGRFNPPHAGHEGAWKKAAQYDNWYVGTNPSTQGAKGKSGKAAENKDPLPYEIKVAAMEAIMPAIRGHIMPESTWWSLATAVYNKHGKVRLVVVSDPEDGAGFVKGLLNSNGKEGRHGYYHFADIVHDAAPRASSATDLRAAVQIANEEAFAQAAGVDPNIKIQGKPYFDLVAHYLLGKEMKESMLGKIVRESNKKIDEVSPELLDRAARKAELASNKASKQAYKTIDSGDSEGSHTHITRSGKKLDQSLKFANKAYDKRKKRGTPFVDETIIASELEEGVNDPHIFKAVFLAGGPGSGKSYVVNKLMKHNGLRVVNSDEIYEYLMKKQDLSLDPETIFSPQGQEIRGKAKELTKRRQGHYMDGRIGLIIDGTGKDVAKVSTERAKLKAMGYDTMMLFVNTSHEIAQHRNKQRERSLEPAVVTKMWQQVQDNIMKFQQVFGAGQFTVIDNSGGLEDPTRAAEFNNVFSQIEKFVNTPPSSYIAKKWINAQRAPKPAARAVDESVELDEASLSIRELTKDNSRLQTFIKKYSGGQPFVARGDDWDSPSIYLKVEPEKLEMLQKGEFPKNFLSQDDKVIAYSHLEKTNEFGGKQTGFSTRDEDSALSSLNEKLLQLKGDQDEISIVIGDKTVNVSHFESTPGTPKSDFHAVNKDGQSVAWISHKKGSSAKDFQQWGGMTDRELAAVYKSFPEAKSEIQSFVADVKEFTSNYNSDTEMPRGVTVGRKIQNGKLRGITVYGINFGGVRGPQNVDVVLQGNPIFDGNTLGATGGSHSNGERVEDEYEPVFLVMYRADRNNFGIKFARFMIYPAGGRRVHQWI